MAFYEGFHNRNHMLLAGHLLLIKYHVSCYAMHRTSKGPVYHAF